MTTRKNYFVPTPVSTYGNNLCVFCNEKVVFNNLNGHEKCLDTQELCRNLSNYTTVNKKPGSVFKNTLFH